MVRFLAAPDRGGRGRGPRASGEQQRGGRGGEPPARRQPQRAAATPHAATQAPYTCRYVPIFT